MLPRVILHIAMSLDGRITNFPADPRLYYLLAARWKPEAILFGSETVLEASHQDPSLEVPPEHEEMFRPLEHADPDPRPLLVIADSRGRYAVGTLSGSGHTCGTFLPCALFLRRRSTSAIWPTITSAPSLPGTTVLICVLRSKHCMHGSV